MSVPPEAPSEVVELRVHGVAGARADHILNCPTVRQVAGDSAGGFYRPYCRDDDSRRSDGVTLEAYRWGDLPSGTAMRTVSLVFLLPFMLCNAAIWMRPVTPGSGAGVRAMCRLLGLGLTALYSLSVVGVALDLIAWKCLASPRCLAGRAWLSWLGGRPPGLRLAVCALVPVTAIALVWFLASRPGRSYVMFQTASSVDAVPRPRLAAVGQWDSGPMLGRLRAIHVAAAFATMDVSLLAARGAAGGASRSTAVLAIAAGCLLVACSALLCAHPVIDRPAPGQRSDRVIRTLPAVSCGLTLLVFGHVLLSPEPWARTTGLPGYGPCVASVLITQTSLLIVLGLAAVWRRRAHKGRHAPLRGLGAPVIASVAVGLAVAFSADLVYRVADLLDRGASAAERMATGPPLIYTWAIFGFLLAVVAALVVAGLMSLTSRRKRSRAAAAIVARDFPCAPSAAAHRLRQVRRAIARAQFTERLEPLVVAYAVLFGLGMTTSVFGLLRLSPGEAISRYTTIPAELVDFMIELGSFLTAAILVGLAVGGIFAYRTAEFRRFVGVIWDLGMFWPRAAHPFAPPCYAERAVPELTRRISYLVKSGNHVLLAGHSQGSVLLATTVLQLPAEIARRVALLTYGSPLRRLYAHLFPAYVNEAVLQEVAQRVEWRWVNLWSDTDQIGSWIFSPHRNGEPPAASGPAGAVDRRLLDPADVLVPADDTVPPPIYGHWLKESDGQFTAAARELAQRLREETAEVGGERGRQERPGGPWIRVAGTEQSST
ncbi:hypothetical protein [Micromonospora sp. NPDC051141]|uniref:hypothetical protein n=1 Tax=Micromonospora sp. NPDC051141 TaxID=3364284 RepID=UPI0037B9724E